MGASWRSTIPVAFYNFTPVVSFGKCKEEVELEDRNLFLDIEKIPDNKLYRFWEGFCIDRRYSYVIAEGSLKDEVRCRQVERKSKDMGKTVDQFLAGKQTKKGHKDYSIGYPDKIFGFFRLDRDLEYLKADETC